MLHTSVALRGMLLKEQGRHIIQFIILAQHARIMRANVWNSFFFILQITLIMRHVFIAIVIPIILIQYNG